MVIHAMRSCYAGRLVTILTHESLSHVSVFLGYMSMQLGWISRLFSGFNRKYYAVFTSCAYLEILSWSTLTFGTALQWGSP
jgi:hypothetical protein